MKYIILLIAFCRPVAWAAAEAQEPGAQEGRGSGQMRALLSLLRRPRVMGRHGATREMLAKSGWKPHPPAGYGKS